MLFGFQLGNRPQSGCLTDDHEARLHICERGTGCPVLDQDDVVYITPVVSRSITGEIVPEMGAGGGAADLLQSHELDLDSSQDVLTLTRLCSEKMIDKELGAHVLKSISEAILCRQKKPLVLDSLRVDGQKRSSIPSAESAKCLANLVEKGGNLMQGKSNLQESLEQKNTPGGGHDLPRIIVCSPKIINEKELSSFRSNSLTHGTRHTKSSVISSGRSTL